MPGFCEIEIQLLFPTGVEMNCSFGGVREILESLLARKWLHCYMAAFLLLFILYSLFLPPSLPNKEKKP